MPWTFFLFFCIFLQKFGTNFYVVWLIELRFFKKVEGKTKRFFIGLQNFGNEFKLNILIFKAPTILFSLTPKQFQNKQFIFANRFLMFTKTSE